MLVALDDPNLVTRRSKIYRLGSLDDALVMAKLLEGASGTFLNHGVRSERMHSRSMYLGRATAEVISRSTAEGENLYDANTVASSRTRREHQCTVPATIPVVAAIEPREGDVGGEAAAREP